MYRGNDESGVSGTGKVLEGVIFYDGTVVLRWTSDPCSTVVWDDFQSFWNVHVASHPSNETVIQFDNGDVALQQDGYPQWVGE